MDEATRLRIAAAIEARGAGYAETITARRVKQREAVKKARKPKPQRPFLGCDGEGAGTDSRGRQHYVLFTAGEETCSRGGGPLGFVDCAEFIVNLPRSSLLVGFSIGYDATQILRGLGSEIKKRILNPKQGKHGPLPVYVGEYAITYQQSQYLSIGRIDRSKRKPSVLKYSTRTIFDVYGFFQCSFVKAITDFEIGTEEERAIIAENKLKRDSFTELTEGITDYCKLECRYLAMLMEKFRAMCHQSGIYPRRWSGAGWLAAALLTQHRIPKRPLAKGEEASGDFPRRTARPAAFEAAANAAYFGGRFETSAVGLLSQPVYEYDIHSAYPAAMPMLPCSLHTRWRHVGRRRKLPDKGIFLANVIFHHPTAPRWCGLPLRRKDGSLYFPLRGCGWYWGEELKAAVEYAGTELVSIREMWIAETKCDCRQWDWVPALYDRRKQLKKAGQPIKTGINSLYGKDVQRVGRSPWYDIAAGGLITAATRAKLLRAISAAPDNVVMIATDAVYSTQELSLDHGEGLGQWEAKKWLDMFIMQPGVYWSPTELEWNNMLSGQPESGVKSRGVRRSIIGRAAPELSACFLDWFAAGSILDRPFPTVPVKIHCFTSIRLAAARNKPWLAGRWSDETKKEGFDWNSKRDPVLIERRDRHIRTWPILPASPLATSEPLAPPVFDLEDDSIYLEAMPDFVPFLPHQEFA